ncbi:MAG: hypothetical protein Q4F28_14950 [Eubacteriales bacterium]|nr:hypothetical protein [Eubacteriales bacterium]
MKHKKVLVFRYLWGDSRIAFATKLTDYREIRRGFLATLQSPTDFCDFMESCFLDSVVVDGIEDGGRQIEDFAQHTKEIVSNLALLNDEALEIYNRYGRNDKRRHL